MSDRSSPSASISGPFIAVQQESRAFGVVDKGTPQCVTFDIHKPTDGVNESPGAFMAH